MLKFLAILCGIGFIFLGIAGFLPTFADQGLLFYYFSNHTLLNLIHIIAGVLAIMAATHLRYTKLYFQLLGIVFTVASIVSFWRHNDLYMLQTNTYDNILHLIIGVIALYLGFSSKNQTKF